jgi:pantoate--beta-alanine ligase
MEVVRSRQALTQAIRALRVLGKTIGLVPTMGALHNGHVSLVGLGLRHAQAVVASIFVNPAQFGPNEDFSRYPRTEQEDLEKLKAAGVSIAYLPAVDEMYPQGFATYISAGKIANELCGVFRPGHFDGVATVVTKLLMQASPDSAIFGEKDYQQLHVIRQVVRDLDIAVRIVGAPIMREKEGLAMSSRNRYLSESERVTAAVLYRTLQQAASKLREGRRAESVIKDAKNALQKAGFTKIDYIELRNAQTLLPTYSAPGRLLAAAWLGNTRLIDNVEV